MLKISENNQMVLVVVYEHWFLKVTTFSVMKGSPAVLVTLDFTEQGTIGQTLLFNVGHFKNWTHFAQCVI